MSTHAWFEHFKEKLQGLTDAFEQSGTPLSLLGYALKEKQLTSDAYLHWAMAHYKLPQLQARFFTETPPSKEMFAKWATHYPWSVECLPVAEWDGALIVACLQPPQDFPSTPSCILVLAPFESMEAAWASYQAPIAAPVPAVKNSANEFSFDDLGASDSSPEIPEGEAIEEVSPEGALEGIFDGPTVVRLEALSPKAETIIEPKMEDLVAVKSETPAATLPNAAPATPAATAKNFDKTIVDPRPAMPGTAANSAPPPPPPAEENSGSYDDSFSNKPTPIVARPAGVAKPTMNPAANGSFALEKIKKKNTAIIAEKVKRTLSEMKVHFEKSMILSLDDQETQVTAFAWDENFQGVKDTSLRVPLKTPSIFNIVAATQKPFHGYISLNELNEKFFEQWNQGKIPDHITISPIMMNEKLVGMLVGFAEKSAYNKVSLNLAEKLSGEFIKGLQAA
ncbi:MAG: hypothetical protein J7501_07470 [Bdellovibrio sp.]|nr:hypothetical protein [Bdellovibrio sp.]